MQLADYKYKHTERGELYGSSSVVGLGNRTTSLAEESTRWVDEEDNLRVEAWAAAACGQAGEREGWGHGGGGRGKGCY